MFAEHCEHLQNSQVHMLANHGVVPPMPDAADIKPLLSLEFRYPVCLFEYEFH